MGAQTGQDKRGAVMGTVHELKIWPQYFDKVKSGEKTFEVRKEDDKYFEVEDVLKLKEWDNNKKIFTGQMVEVEVTYILRGPCPAGIEKGTVVMAIKRLAAQR